MRLIRYIKNLWNKGLRSRLIMLLALLFLLSTFIYVFSLISDWHDRKQQQELMASLQTVMIVTTETPIRTTTTQKATESTVTESTETETTITETTTEEITETTIAETTIETTIAETEEKFPAKVDFARLKEKNPDTVGWIEIPGTIINYPIVKAEDNKYYLHRDFNGKNSKSGSIFMDYRNKGDFADRHTILYGHNMRNGSMFAGLMAYKNSSFFIKNNKIIIHMPEGRTIWLIFAVYVTTTDFYYIITDFPDDPSFSAFLKTIENKSHFQRDISPIVSDNLLTLSTCTYEYDDARFVVHAIRVDH